jgi:hypothetical protein
MMFGTRVPLSSRATESVAGPVLVQCISNSVPIETTLFSSGPERKSHRLTHAVPGYFNLFKSSLSRQIVFLQLFRALTGLWRG